MKYEKPPLDFERQADLLKARGLLGDREAVIARLQAVGYYRLSGYWYPFRQPNPADPRCPLDSFKEGTTFDQVWSRYVFDRRLRLVVMDALERIEVSVRSGLACHHALDHGQFAYVSDQASLPKIKTEQWTDFVKRVCDERDRSKEPFTKHFFEKYGDEHQHLPVWVVTEVMSFGTILTFFRNASRKVKQGIASMFEMPDAVFDSWLLTLNSVRNICAHHGRLWNRELGVTPIIPRIKEYPQWHTPVKVDAKRMFAVLTICKWSIDRVAPQSHWADRLRTLLQDFPQIPLISMGFPANWHKCPIWQATPDVVRKLI